MKTKGLFLIILVLLVVSSMAVISAVETTKTVVAGKVYNAGYTSIISEANVTVTCTYNSTSTNTTKNTLSLADGSYSVQFTADECALGDTIDVYGFKDGLFDTGDGTQVNIDMSPSIDLALGVSNLALIPEFGAVVGVLTILSALGVFFVIRRK